MNRNTCCSFEEGGKSPDFLGQCPEASEIIPGSQFNFSKCPGHNSFRKENFSGQIKITPDVQ